jgi:FAD synthase
MVDMNGQIVHQEVINTTIGKNTYRLNLTKEIAAGQYIITVYGDGVKEAIKVLKQ